LTMNPPTGEEAPSTEVRESAPKTFLTKLKKRHIIETLAAFIGGGWLLLEFVHWLLVDHYHFPEKTIDITFVTILGTLLCTLIWRWFSGREAPRKFKLEFALIPLVLLATFLLDINLLLHLKTPESGTIPASKWKNSVAVLPFDNISPEEGQDYFCEGLTDELITRLSNLRELKVIAKTSAYAFKGKEIDIREIGKKLNVATVLEGGVRKSGNKLRITAQLINVSDGSHLWSDSWDKDITDVFAIQDEIALAVADRMKLTLLSDEKSRLVKRPMDNVSAYEFYLRASREIDRYREDALDRAIQYLQNGLDLIGENALVYSAMAYAYWQYVNIGAKQEDYIIKAEEYANKALAMDPDSPNALLILGLIESAFRGNQQESVRYLKKALLINPNDPVVLFWLANAYFQYVGKISAGIPLAQRLLQLDPLNQPSYALQGVGYYYDGKYDLALGQLTKAYQMDPGNLGGLCRYALVLAYNKKSIEAFPIIERLAKDSPNNTFSKIALLLKFGLLKDREQMLQIMTPDFQKTCQRDAAFSYDIAIILALLGEKNKALDWLENAVNRGFINFPLLAEKDPWLADRPLRRLRWLLARRFRPTPLPEP
jgi:eukaryotic-like serine/threonine-protein kinase